MKSVQLRLRDVWIEAENARTEAYKAFMQANKNSPLRRELDAADKAEKAAHDEYRQALQTQTNESTE